MIKKLRSAAAVDGVCEECELISICVRAAAMRRVV